MEQAGQQTNSQPAATAAQQPATQQATEVQNNQAGQPSLIGKQEAAEKPAQATEKAPEKAQAYDFKAPEGVTFDQEVIKSYADAAKELGLTQEAAQKMLDKIAPVLHERNTKQLEENARVVYEQWREQSTGDKEFGGEKLTENLSVAQKFVKSFGTPELEALLESHHLGDHPEIIRVFFRAGKAISQDRYVGGSSPKAGNAASARSFNDHASILYPQQ